MEFKISNKYHQKNRFYTKTYLGLNKTLIYLFHFLAMAGHKWYIRKQHLANSAEKFRMRKKLIN